MIVRVHPGDEHELLERVGYKIPYFVWIEMLV